MGIGKTIAVFGASFVGIVLGHNIIRNLTGGGHRRQYNSHQDQQRNQNRQQNNQQNKHGVDSLRGKRLFDN